MAENEADALRRKLSKKMVRIEALLREVDERAANEKRAVGEAEGLRRAVEALQAKMLEERGEASRREKSLEEKIQAATRHPRLDKTVAALQESIEKKDFEMKTLIETNRSMHDTTQLIALKELLALRESELQQTRLHLLKYKRRAEALENKQDADTEQLVAQLREEVGTMRRVAVAAEDERIELQNQVVDLTNQVEILRSLPRLDC